MRRPVIPLVVAAVVFLIAVLLATHGGKKVTAGAPPAPTPQASFVPNLPTPTESALPGMPPPLSASNIYAADAPNQLSPTVKGYPSLIYVPNTLSSSVDVIDPKTNQIVEHFAVGKDPEHVVPAWDLKTLYVTSDEGNSLTPIDASTGRPGPAIHVEDPYNLYFTPDGQFGIVVAERLKELNFINPTTMQVAHSLAVPCKGVDHIDFSADGTYLLATCEFGGNLIKVDVATQQVVASLMLPTRGRTLAQPQDIKLSPDGKTFYVADMTAGGVYLVNGDSLRVDSFLPTGKNAHGLYVSRDAQDLYVANRGAGSVSVVSFATQQVVATWAIPGGGSPDMGGVSADGTVLWLSGRYNAEVYGFNTTTGALVARIPVGNGPHGLCVYPQPGRYSLGHTGILR